MLALSLLKCLASLHVIYVLLNFLGSNNFIHYSSMKLHCVYIHAILTVFINMKSKYCYSNPTLILWGKMQRLFESSCNEILQNHISRFPTTSLIVSSILQSHHCLLLQIFLMIAMPTPSHSVALIFIINV